MVNNTVIYEALAEQYLHSILDISEARRISRIETDFAVTYLQLKAPATNCIRIFIPPLHNTFIKLQ